MTKRIKMSKATVEFLGQWVTDERSSYRLAYEREFYELCAIEVVSAGAVEDNGEPEALEVIAVVKSLSFDEQSALAEEGLDGASVFVCQSCNSHIWVDLKSEGLSRDEVIAEGCHCCHGSEVSFDSLWTKKPTKEPRKFSIIIKDVSEFGRVGLQGVHQVIDSDRDVLNVIHNIERDGFDRAFVYVRGFDDATFDVGEVTDLIRQLEDAGGALLIGQRGPHVERLDLIHKALTFKQYAKLTNDIKRSYPATFERALKISKSAKVKQAAIDGLKFCQLFGWSA
jgi:hypothetical protein